MMSSSYSNGNWRLIDSGVADPAFTMAVDEAILLSRVKSDVIDNPVPEATLHLYSRDPPAVSLGYFQKVRDEIEIDLCERLGVQILRRGSGGGAIYTDRNQVIYGLVISGDKLGTIQNSFNVISKGVIEALKFFGLNAEIQGLNDIVINNRKISGCAQTRKSNIILQHGTFLIDFDRSRVSQILTPSTMKFSDKNVKGPNGYMTSLANILGYAPTHDEVKKNLIWGFEKAFNIKLTKGQLLKDEENLVKDLLNRKYNNSSWNFRR